MLIYIISTGYWFFRVIEIGIIAYVIFSWLPIFPKLQSIVIYIMDPLLAPIRHIIHYSVFRVRGIDLSPVILYLIVAFGSQFCYSLR